MNGDFNRRSFLGGAMTASWVASRAACISGQNSAKAERILDIHVHLFGTGDSGSGCRLSKTASEGKLFKYLAANLRLLERAETIDEGYELALVEQIEQSGLDRAVILAQDAVYNKHGKPDWNRTHFYIPNDYLLRIVAHHPGRMIPCVSINPERADAIEELNRCAAGGARLLKIHPPIQGVDLAEKKHTPFFRRCVDLSMIVMVHTGHEHTGPVIDIGLAHPRKLELALESGCTVIACHCGTGWPQDAPDMLPEFLAMVRRYKNLWGDTAVLGSAGRVRDFQRLCADRVASERLLHGSDFPFPAAPVAFARVIGFKRALSLQAMGNWMEQDLALKEALGIGRTSAERAYRMICNATNRQ
ncbi:MAG: amidohydrolase family protein [Pirellulales bacterium]|nr:amidohydrolase family protein [Pirellulales bacterium]